MGQGAGRPGIRRVKAAERHGFPDQFPEPGRDEAGGLLQSDPVSRTFFQRGQHDVASGRKTVLA